MSANGAIFEAFAGSWPASPGLLATLALTALIYWRGWRRLRRRDPGRWSSRQPISYILGLSAIALALASPIEPFANLLLQVHMAQHLLLMMAAPPLIWLGEPMFPMLRGLPTPVRRHWVAPVLRSPAIRDLFTVLTHPFCALPVFVAATWAWHAPAAYDAAAGSDRLHYLQHLTFLATGLLFWYPVIRPYPANPRWPRWLLVPYLILADVQNTILAALLTFSDRVVYALYERLPRITGQSALEDQAAAGVMMWVPGSIAFLVPLAWIGTRSLFPGEQRPKRVSLPVAGDKRFDALRLPVIGRLLRWRLARLVAQLTLLAVSCLLIVDGFTGVQVAPLNLAGVVPWIHWRGALILALLVAGNVFCFACPFMLPRAVGRRILPASLAWPRPLRNKWMAIALLAAFLWAYETFSLWDSPWLTAWIIVAYFAAALMVDGLFRGAAFCKYICPIGQFNFVQSLMSPLEVQALDRKVCSECESRDCIRGRPAESVRGCELSLFLPRKAGNFDCTMCLDCVHACPHDNVGLVAVAPGAELWRDAPRSGIGRFGRRPDIAALVVLLAVGAFANAGGMVGPVVEWQNRVQLETGLSRLAIVSMCYVAALVIAPAVAISIAAGMSRWAGRPAMSFGELAARFSYSLVPLGFAMWLSHYSFHLFTSFDAVVPAAQRFAADYGWSVDSTGRGVCDCCRPAPEWLLHTEILALDVGMLFSLYAAWRIGVAITRTRRQAFVVALPWAALIGTLFATGIWIVLQPMQMRGTMGMP